MADEGVAAEPAEEEAAPAEDAAEATEELPRRHGAVVVAGRDMDVLHVSRDQLVDVVCALREDEGFTMCLDLTGVDYLTYDAPRDLPPGIEPERFEVVVLLISHERRERVRLRVQVPEDDPTCPSLFDVHPGTEAMEREVYDMFGITFTDHPDLTRILMPEDWEGHPLRKDAAIGRIPVQFKAPQDAR